MQRQRKVVGGYEGSHTSSFSGSLLWASEASSGKILIGAHQYMPCGVHTEGSHVAVWPGWR